MKIHNIIFDFGGVLVDWNPRYLYEKVFEDKQEMEYFLSEVCNDEWNVQQDAGRLLKDATETLQSKYPEYTKQIQRYYDDWEEMLNGALKENVDLLYKIDKKKFKLLGLTNWSGETFPIAYKRFSFFSEFEGIVVSGDEKMIKPDKRIFDLLLNRYKIKAENSLFIDDNEKNILTAKEMGFQTIHFRDPINLQEEFFKLGLI